MKWISSKEKNKRKKIIKENKRKGKERKKEKGKRKKEKGKRKKEKEKRKEEKEKKKRKEEKEKKKRKKKREKRKEKKKGQNTVSLVNTLLIPFGTCESSTINCSVFSSFTLTFICVFTSFSSAIIFNFGQVDFKCLIIIC